MREAFRGWYKPTGDDLRVLWERGKIVLDSNVLLAPYRLAAEARTRLFDLVQAYRDQVWVPYQAGLEYQRNRLTVVAAQRGTYEDIRKELGTAERSLLQRRRDHPVLEPAEFEAVVKRALQGIARHVDRAESGHPEVLGDDRDDDVVRDRWDELLAGCFGPRLEVDDAWRREADKRYEAGVPPGFADMRKNKDGREYGDLILWDELRAYVGGCVAKGEDSVPVIFVTDDAKEDWWRISDGQRLGPRPELVEELESAGGRPFWTYSVSRFVQVGSQKLGWELSLEITAEVEATAEGGEQEPDADEQTLAGDQEDRGSPEQSDVTASGNASGLPMEGYEPERQ